MSYSGSAIAADVAMAEEAIGPIDTEIQFNMNPLTAMFIVGLCRYELTHKKSNLYRDPRSLVKDINYPSLFRGEERLTAMSHFLKYLTPEEISKALEIQEQFDTSPKSNPVPITNKGMLIENKPTYYENQQSKKYYEFNPVLGFVNQTHFTISGFDFDRFNEYAEEVLQHFRLGLSIDAVEGMGEQNDSRYGEAQSWRVNTRREGNWRENLRKAIRNIDKNKLMASQLALVAKLPEFYEYNRQLQTMFHDCVPVDYKELGYVYKQKSGSVTKDHEKNNWYDPEHDDSSIGYFQEVEFLGKLKSPYNYEKDKVCLFFKDVKTGCGIKIAVGLYDDEAMSLLTLVSESNIKFGMAAKTCSITKNSEADLCFFNAQKVKFIAVGDE